MSHLRLGFHYHVPAQQRFDGIYVPGYLGVFIDSLADHCVQVICFSHSPAEGDTNILDYRLKGSNIRLVNLGVQESVTWRTLKARRLVEPIRQARSEMDVLLLRGPSPLLPDAAHAVGEFPTALLIVGDYLAGARDASLPWPRWPVNYLWSWWYQQRQLQVARKTLTFVNSRKLYNQYATVVPNLIETRTTTLGESDFFLRQDTCQSSPIHLLYTGRMESSKGLFDLIQAGALLVSNGLDIHIDLVGWADKGDSILDEVFQKARSLSIVDRVHYHGYKGLGEELFSYYKEADVYVMASNVSEGFPRTIWEAMAHSLPVVATLVGSIPDYIYGAAELVPPKDPHALYTAIRRIVQDGDYRQNLIVKGMNLARQNTLEYQTGKMVLQIEEWMNDMVVDEKYSNVKNISG